MSDEEILTAIERKHGTLTAEAVVQEAKAKGHPFHERIWGESDKEAAHQRRLHLAREIIRSVRFVIHKGPPIIRSPVFVKDPTIKPNEAGYKSVAKIRTKTEQAMASLQLEVDRIESSLSRGDSLAAAYGLEREFAAMLEKLGIQRWQFAQAAE